MPFRASHRSFARSCVAEVWTVCSCASTARVREGGSVKIGPLNLTKPRFLRVAVERSCPSCPGLSVMVSYNITFRNFSYRHLG